MWYTWVVRARYTITISSHGIFWQRANFTWCTWSAHVHTVCVLHTVDNIKAIDCMLGLPYPFTITYEERRILTNLLYINILARKTRFTLTWHCREQRKIRCLERDLNSPTGIGKKSPLHLPIDPSSQTSIKSSRKYFVHLSWMRSGNPKMRAQIALETTNCSLFSAVSD